MMYLSILSSYILIYTLLTPSHMALIGNVIQLKWLTLVLVYLPPIWYPVDHLHNRKKMRLQLIMCPQLERSIYLEV